jgi:hypothetical protein
MGKASRIKQQSAREKIAAQRLAAQRLERRNRILITGGSTLLVLVIVAVFIVVKLSQGSPAQAKSTVGGTLLPASVSAQVTGVPATTLDAVGKGAVAPSQLKPGLGGPLTSAGKPEMLYIGAEFCPYCAAERWAMAAAVSRFGTLSGLRFLHSSPTDIYPNTATLSFYRSSYTSKYLSFVPVEWYGEQDDPSTPLRHVYLQHPTQQQVGLFSKYSGGAIPFVDIGNQYQVPQAQYVPSALAGLSWAQVAAAMRDPGSAVGKDIDGAANMITAAICKLTRGQPGGVCASAGVTAASGSI